MKASSLKFYLSHPIHGLAKCADILYRKIYPNIPWITPQSVAKLSEILQDGQMRGFEWGSGKSTLWFSKYCSELHSIEYDNDWYRIVKEQIAERRLPNIHIHYIPLEHEKSVPTYPIYNPTPKYVSFINNFPDLYFDFIVIDGHYRQACVLEAVKHLRPGGYLIIDNYNRVPNAKEWGVPDQYLCIHKSSNIVTTTAIFQSQEINELIN